MYVAIKSRNFVKLVTDWCQTRRLRIKFRHWYTKEQRYTKDYDVESEFEYMNVREWFLHDFSSIAVVMWSQMEHDQMFIHVINPTLFHRILKIIVYLIDIPPNSTISISKYKLKIPKVLKTRIWCVLGLKKSLLTEIARKNSCQR